MLLSLISKPLMALVLALVLTLVGALASLTPPVDVLRERAFDIFLQHRAGSPARRDVVVVDIDRATLDVVGPWPWSRDKLATLVEIVADGKPRAVGLDFLLVGPDERSPGALARQLAASAGDDATQRIAAEIAAKSRDFDTQLADSLRKTSVALGLVLDSDRMAGVPGAAAMLMRGNPQLADAWTGEFPIGSIELIAKAAGGHGLLILPGDADARIRRVPLMVATAVGPRPGLALEVLRLASQSSSYVLRGDVGEVRTGTLRIPLGDDGMLRLRPTPLDWHAPRTLSAARLLQEPATRQLLADRFVLLGSSAPELGGLRPSASGSLIPSVQIQADAVSQMLSGYAPVRPRALVWPERATALIAGTGVILAALTLSPLAAGGIAVSAIAAWLGLAAGLINRGGILLDPLLVPAVLIAGFALATLLAASDTRRREAFIRRRFEQHLAPAVVQRIVDEPHLLKLSGEAREITVIFTDIEGFTSLTERAGPVELVALLDAYIDGASRIILEYGGMVDKVIGDGMHALFNAPIDLPDHPLRAFECALALQAFTEAMRREPDAERLGLGRTRIGIETGPVIVGDVGGGKRLNYTAHGNAVNRAARLEAANKELASQICIGPVAATRLPAERLRPLGRISLRGVADAVEVYEPWPDAMGETARAAYRAAFADYNSDPRTSAASFGKLAGLFPGDAVIARLRRESEAKIA